MLLVDESVFVDGGVVADDFFVIYIIAADTAFHVPNGVFDSTGPYCTQ